MPGIASSSPAVLLARVAAETSTIRLGSGGVMLPNHSPLVIAEQFGMLEALEPGRIDLGIGRAPAPTRPTAYALRRGAQGSDGDDLPQLLAELLAHFTGGFPDDHPYSSIHATPARGYQPAIWLLGSSDYSAHLAGQLGLPFSFAHHFAAANTDAALQVYRSAFRPSDVLEAPYVMLGVNVVCAEDSAEAQRLAAPRPPRLPAPAPGQARRCTRARRRRRPTTSPRSSGSRSGAGPASHVIGDPDEVRSRARGPRGPHRRRRADAVHDAHAADDRIRSFELVADALALERRRRLTVRRGRAGRRCRAAGW